MPLVVEDGSERVEDLGAGTERVAESLDADRHDHELLEIGRVLGMLAAVEDVEHRHGQDPRPGPAEVAVERQLMGIRCGMGACQRHAQEGIGTQPALVRRAVELEEHPVDAGLVSRVVADEGWPDRLADVDDGPQDTLAAIATLVPVAQLDRLVGAGRGSGRDGRAPQ